MSVQEHGDEEALSEGEDQTAKPHSIHAKISSSHQPKSRRGPPPKGSKKGSTKPNVTATIAGGTADVEKRTVPLINRDELEIEGELGKGVFGKVFKGTLRDIVVAVKELKSRKIDNIDQFQAEISIMAHLRHPNIVLFMGASFDPPFIVTEYLDGGDLHDVIQGYEDNLKQGVLPPINEILKLSIGIARGMSWLHKSIPPIVHKDLKPKNIMLDSHGNPKIIDFGLSEEQKTKEIENRKISGSASWMSPEMLKGENYTEKIDVFAFGIILWQLAAGSTVVYDTSKYESLPTQQALQAFITDITDNKMRPTIPQHLRNSEEPELLNLIEQCWEDDPNVRPSFSYIVKALVRIYLSTALKEDSAIRLWKHYFGTKVKGIAPSDFFSAIWNVVAQTEPPDANSSPALIVKHKCLQAVSLSSNNRSIDIERFGLILQWYGPLTTTPMRGTFLDRIESILKNKWFHGEITSKEAENLLLAGNDKFKRDFIVRSSLNSQYPFTMSRIEGTKMKKSFAHYRIAYNRNSGEYSMTFETKSGGRQDIIKADSLAQFVKIARSTLGLKKPIPCTEYSHIFIEHINEGSSYIVPLEKSRGFFN